MLQFVAEEGTAYLPQWVLKHLLLEPGDLVNLQFVTMPKATFVKLKPLSPDFQELPIQDPVFLRKLLETRLRHFSCLSKDDVVAFNYQQQVYELEVTETRPGDAVCIQNRDIEMELDGPPGYHFYFL